MKFTKAKIATLILLLVTLVIIGGVVHSESRKNELAKCSSIGDWSEIAKSVIETCHGVLAVQDEDSNFPDKYIVSDQKHDYMVAGLQW